MNPRTRQRLPLFCFLCLLLLAAVPSQAEVRLQEVFTDGMCLQRDKPVPVWGTADAGETVTVKIAGQQVSAAAGTDRKWRITLAPMKPGGPLTMTVAGKNRRRPASSKRHSCP